MTKVEKPPRVHLAILAPYQHFVVHQAIPVYQMDYVEKAAPLKWVPALTSLGLVEAVSNIAVRRKSYREKCAGADLPSSCRVH
jgi:hypothetical protein